MAHQHINIVYRNLPATSATTFDRNDLGMTIEWSRRETSDADCVVSFNAYSGNVRNRRRRPSSASRILLIAEPVVVHPNQYAVSCWRKFDAAITCNHLLAAESSFFHYLPVINYGYPFPSRHAVTGTRPTMDQLRHRKNGLCQICGSKTSLLSQELYSLRRHTALWFAAHSGMVCDVYGDPAMNVPNYRGVAVNKLATLRGYRYALCFENCYDKRWSAGYLTEKLFDCFYAGAVPVYKGCYDIERYVPADCFIDYRTFAGEAELERFLQSLTYDDYVGYVERIWRFLERYDPQRTLHADRLYELIARIHSGRRDGDVQTHTHREWPEDFTASGVSLRDRMAFTFSCFLLNTPGLITMMSSLQTMLARSRFRSRLPEKRDEVVGEI